jgi:hypothetical protein
MRELKYGGQIVPGDFIAVSYQNHIDLGWYAGNGSGTLQYYTFRSPGNAHELYQKWLNEPESTRSKWSSKKYEKGFTRKCLWKSYINAVHATRVMKITNPEEIFTEQEDLQEYEKSKEALLTLNFIKQ